MARRPKGVLTRSEWNFHPDRLMGGWDTFNQASAFANIIVFNNDRTGNYLYILSVQGSTDTNSAINFTILPPGTTYTAAVQPAAALKNDGPLRAGLLGHFASTTCLALSHIGGSGNAQVNSFSTGFDYPIAVIQPGYMFGVETHTLSATLLAGIVWYVGPAP